MVGGKDFAQNQILGGTNHKQEYITITEKQEDQTPHQASLAEDMH